MHDTALQNASRFFRTYLDNVAAPTVVEIGSLDVVGSIRERRPPQSRYIGVDLTPGPGVDIVMEDPYKLPFESESVDAVVSSSCFEHSEFFWLAYLEVMRVLKPTGLLYLNVPSNGAYHRYPVDCWRFYPDSGQALANWGRRNGFDSIVLESYVGNQIADIWNDFVCVILKNQHHAGLYPRRILDDLADFTNGWRHGSSEVIHFAQFPEDQKPIAWKLKKKVRKVLRRVAGGLAEAK